jgi:hypothetical protein
MPKPKRTPDPISPQSKLTPPLFTSIDGFLDAVDAIDCLMGFLDTADGIKPKELYCLLNPHRDALVRFAGEF